MLDEQEQERWWKRPSGAEKPNKIDAKMPVLIRREDIAHIPRNVPRKKTLEDKKKRSAAEELELSGLTKDDDLAKALENTFSECAGMEMQYQICVLLHDQPIPLWMSEQKK